MSNVQEPGWKTMQAALQQMLWYVGEASGLYGKICGMFGLAEHRDWLQEWYLSDQNRAFALNIS